MVRVANGVELSPGIADFEQERDVGFAAMARRSPLRLR